MALMSLNRRACHIHLKDQEEVWREKILPHIAEVYLWNLVHKGLFILSPTDHQTFWGQWIFYGKQYFTIWSNE